MIFQIGIEVDGSRIAWVQSSDKLKSVLTKLTTLTKDQSTAIIKFFLKIGEKNLLISTETLNAIPSMEAGTPAIDVLTTLSGKTLTYRLSLNGILITERRMSIRKYLPGKIPVLLIILIIALITASAALIIFIPRNTEKSKVQSTPISAPAVKPATEKPTALPEKKPAEKTETKTSEKPDAEAVSETMKDSSEPARIVPEEPSVTWTESEIFDDHSVYFDADSAVLTAETIAELNAFISALPAADDFEEGFFELAVRGHCAKYGTEEGRAELSRERALNVTNYLKKRWGIDADYVTSGAGSSEPVSLARDQQHLNRRVDIDIKGSIRKKIASNQES